MAYFDNTKITAAICSFNNDSQEIVEVNNDSWAINFIPKTSDKRYIVVTPFSNPSNNHKFALMMSGDSVKDVVLKTLVTMQELKHALNDEDHITRSKAAGVWRVFDITPELKRASRHPLIKLIKSKAKQYESEGSLIVKFGVMPFLHDVFSVSDDLTVCQSMGRLAFDKVLRRTDNIFLLDGDKNINQTNNLMNEIVVAL